MVVDRMLVRLLRGLVTPFESARTYADKLWLDLLPGYTRELGPWERQFALPPGTLSTADRRTRLAGRWQAQGGQSPSYVTRTLQAHGFAVYDHPWWGLTAWGVPDPRDPRDYLLPAYGGTDTEGHLVGALAYTLELTDEIGAGEAWAECGEDRAEAGYYAGLTPVSVAAQYVPGADWYHVYIGGAVFPATVDIPATRRTEFETLCRQIIPAHLWIVLRVRYV